MEEGRIGIAGESYREATLRKIKGKGGDRHTREEKSLRVMYHCTQKIFYEHGKSHFHPAPSICLSGNKSSKLSFGASWETEKNWMNERERTGSREED